jgi:hypothetical protein
VCRRFVEDLGEGDVCCRRALRAAMALSIEQSRGLQARLANARYTLFDFAIFRLESVLFPLYQRPHALFPFSLTETATVSA